MRRFKRIMGPVVCLAVVAGVLISLIVPGCVDQNQDNSPISVNNSSGRSCVERDVQPGRLHRVRHRRPERLPVRRDLPPVRAD